MENVILIEKKCIDFPFRTKRYVSLELFKLCSTSEMKETRVKIRVKPVKKDQFLLFLLKLSAKNKICIFQFVLGIWTIGPFASDEANIPRNA